MAGTNRTRVTKVEETLNTPIPGGGGKREGGSNNFCKSFHTHVLGRVLFKRKRKKENGERLFHFFFIYK